TTDPKPPGEITMSTTNPHLTAKDADAVVFTKSNCPKCEDTKTLMDSLGIDYEVVSLDGNREALAYVKAAGFKQAPVVFTASESWSGFQEDKIRDMRATPAEEDDALWDF